MNKFSNIILIDLHDVLLSLLQKFSSPIMWKETLLNFAKRQPNCGEHSQEPGLAIAWLPDNSSENFRAISHYN